MPKNILFIIFLCGSMQFSFAETEFSVFNCTNKKLEIEFIKPRLHYVSLYRGSRPIFTTLDREFLNPNEALIISSEETVLIDNKFFKLKFEETNQECSWIHVLNLVKKTHGIGVKLYINDQFINTICLNSYSPLDFKYHANVEYHGIDNELYTFKIYNTGWWENKDIFPTHFTFKFDNQ